jgi:hypothetical protein
MLVPFEEEDFLSSAKETSTELFTDKVVFNKYLELILKELTNIQTTIKDLIQRRSIDEASGWQLDVIGKIVGQPRTLINLDVYKYFAFFGYPHGETYGDANDPSKGGMFYSSGSPIGGNYTLEDNVYRIFIKSKILKNKTAATPEELITFLKFLFGDDILIYLKEGTASITIFFGRPLSQLELNLLSSVNYDLGYPSRLIPKPVGVGVEYAHFKTPKFFAFKGVPHAKGFKDANATIGWGEDWDINYGGDIGSDTSVGGFLASYYDI